MALSTNPPKGTRDWAPDEFRIRKYIFDTWRGVCERYGYQEYLTPIVEHADVYRAKSGEDVGGAELVTFEDRGGRELSIRPEMTPSVTRMVSGMYESAPKPLRLFSIANFMRNERPQRGRNREFWQLNADLFGDESVASDVEILQMSLDLMLAFNPPEKSFVLKLNSRGVINAILARANVAAEKQQEVVRILDKWDKLSGEETAERLEAAGVLSEGQKVITEYMNGSDIDLVEGGDHMESVERLGTIMKTLEVRGYGQYIAFAPEIIRGFDYYDGVIFEMFDLHTENNRAMFGGGRYNGLADIFGRAPFPSIGFAPGDEPMRLFLESWGLLGTIENAQTERYYVPLLDADTADFAARVASILRGTDKSVTAGLSEQSLGKAFKYAEKSSYTHVVLAGAHESEGNFYITKNMATGKEERVEL